VDLRGVSREDPLEVQPLYKVGERGGEIRTKKDGVWEWAEARRLKFAPKQEAGRDEGGELLS